MLPVTCEFPVVNCCTRLLYFTYTYLHSVTQWPTFTILPQCLLYPCLTHWPPDPHSVTHWPAFGLLPQPLLQLRLLFLSLLACRPFLLFAVLAFTFSLDAMSLALQSLQPLSAHQQPGQYYHHQAHTINYIPTQESHGLRTMWFTPSWFTFASSFYEQLENCPRLRTEIRLTVLGWGLGYGWG